jgi:hypothetical protein
VSFRAWLNIDDDFEPNAVLPIRCQPTQNSQNRTFRTQFSQFVISNRYTNINLLATRDRKRAHIFIEEWFDSPEDFDVSTPLQRQEQQLIPIGTMQSPSSLSVFFPSTKCNGVQSANRICWHGRLQVLNFALALLVDKSEAPQLDQSDCKDHFCWED